MAERSLPGDYFDGIFAGDADPWGLASSPYEQAKFDHSIAALGGRRYGAALEVGCAGGVFTGRLAAVCDDLLAVDISPAALDQAQRRLDGAAGVRFAQMAFPQQTPGADGFDLIVLSEVAYYWSDADLARAADYVGRALRAGGDLLLVHYTDDTDYPQTGDGAVAALDRGLHDRMQVVAAERGSSYRLDLWRRR